MCIRDSNKNEWTVLCTLEISVKFFVLNKQIFDSGLCQGCKLVNSMKIVNQFFCVTTAARLVLGGVYRHLGESMKLLWSRDLVMNTVHVHDLVRAIWYLVQKPQAEGQIYNVADDNHTTQGTVTDIISEIFNINHDYYGNILSTMRKVVNVRRILRK